MFSHDFLSLLQLRYPIIQGPMNSASPVSLVAAVSNAGALGSFAAALCPPEKILEQIKQIRAQTSCLFNVNLFVLKTPSPTVVELANAQALLAPFRESLGLSAISNENNTTSKFCENFQDQLAALREAAPPVVSFTFGILDAQTIIQFKKLGSVVIGTASTVAEALAWEDAGADLICAQGSEAGGHRATFLGDFEQSSIGTMALVPQMVAKVNIPVIAAGGIMNGQGIAAALRLGASAVQLGTAFLVTPESGISDVWRNEIINAHDDSTRLTRTFSGRYARGIVNEFMQKMQSYEHLVPDYPVQNALTTEIRQAATKQGRADCMSLWAGQGAPMARVMPVAELVQVLAAELNALTST